MKIKASFNFDSVSVAQDSTASKQASDLFASSFIKLEQISLASSFALFLLIELSISRISTFVGLMTLTLEAASAKTVLSTIPLTSIPASASWIKSPENKNAITNIKYVLLFFTGSPLQL